MIDVEDAEAPWGPVRTLHVGGAWSPDVVTNYRHTGANSVAWRPTRARGLDLSPLLELADSLEDVQVISKVPIEDSALGALAELRSAVVLTKATNPLDLSRLRQLRLLTIDDRPGLSGIGGDQLTTVSVFRNQRSLRDFEAAPALADLTLEGDAGQRLSTNADLPSLAWLMVRGHRVDTLAGLHAPRLEHISLVGEAQEGSVLDLIPLADLPNLRKLTVSSVAAVTGVRALAERSDLDIRLGARTAIAEADASASLRARLNERVTRFGPS